MRRLPFVCFVILTLFLPQGSAKEFFGQSEDRPTPCDVAGVRQRVHECAFYLVDCAKNPPCDPPLRRIPKLPDVGQLPE